MALCDLLKLPAARGISDLDDPGTTALHRAIIAKKPFLKRLYADYYAFFRQAVPPPLEGKTMVELGSGGGFIKDVIPNAITSDVLPLAWVDRSFSALEMPFGAETVDAFFMFNVLHHLPDAERFFSELTRCLKPGGAVVMIEPANTCWSRFVYQRFHHERFDPAADWSLAAGGPLSAANDALPWIIFTRDRARFEQRFPQLTIKRVSPHTPLRYVLSGGVSMRQLLPAWMYTPVKAFEWLLTPLHGLLGMYQTIELEKRR